jgi:maltose alpha-D-glucosyltransferase/alpha-amylase
VSKSYYWHRFYSHQPDLNFENPHVHKALFKVIDFWLAMGVDGLRLDAVPYLYEQEGTNCENLPQTFAFLKKLRAHVEARFPGRMLLAEANQWPEDAVAYFGNGDMCHMAFHFPLMPRMFLALQMEDRFPILDILEQTPAIPENAQWAIFLRNHDELTLEMVSEEERDFMYRSYAREMSARINLGIRRRLAPLVQNSRRRIELLNILLLSLPGTPVIYYGDEIGMGDNHHLGDRNGVRTPMQWSADRNAGFSHVNPQGLFLPVIIDPEYHYQTVNVENEERNLSSLLWWTRRAIAMRRSFTAFSLGSMEVVKSSNASILSFIRKSGDETILVVVNLSRFSQPVSLDLGAYSGMIPVDVFSGNRFPRVSSGPYPMTLGFHDYFWLHLKPDVHADPRTESYVLPNFEVDQRWTDIFEGESGRQIFADILPDYLQQRTTAGCREKLIHQTTLIDQIPLRRKNFASLVLLVRVRYADGENDTIFLPLTMESEEKANAVIGEDKGLILGFTTGGTTGVVYDCAYHPVFLEILVDMIRNRRTIHGVSGTVVGESEGRKADDSQDAAPSARLMKAGKRNSSVVLNEKQFIKLYRRIDEGNHPETELHNLLSKRDDALVSRYIGSVSYRSGDNGSFVLGMCIDYFHHSRTLWHIAVDAVSQYLEETLAGSRDTAPTPNREGLPIPSPGTSIAIFFLKKIRIIGELTARMHRELAAGKEEEFRAEPFSPHYQRSLYQSFRGLTHRILVRVEARCDSLPETQAAELRALVSQEKAICATFLLPLRQKLSASRVRIHGDFHLGQIMTMDEKYRICDFEGPGTASLGERRLKRSPLRDIASMIHSLFWAAQYALVKSIKIQESDRQLLLPVAQQWAAIMGDAFFQSYLVGMQGTSLIPQTIAETNSLVRLFLLERGLVDIEKSLDSAQVHLPIALRCLQYYRSGWPGTTIDSNPPAGTTGA